MRSQLFRYTSAVLIVAAAVAVRFALGPWLAEQVPFLTFFPAVAIAMLLVGPGPAAATAVLGLLASHFLSPPPAVESAGSGTGLYVAYVIASALIIITGVLAERRQARAESDLRALGESEARFRHMADSAPVLIWLADANKKGTYFNRTWLEFTGRTLQQELDDGWLSSIHPEDRGALRVYDRALEARTTFTTQFRLRSASGDYRWVLYSGAPFFGADGGFRGFIGTCVDITDRKAAEESRAWLAAIVAASTDAIISKTLDGTILSWNEAAQRMFGYSADEAVGRPIDIILPPELREDERKIFERLRRGDIIEHFETVRQRKDGQRIDVALTISPVRDEAGRIVGASKVARDITEHKRVQQAITASEERYRAVVESQTEMICRFRADGIILFANKAYARTMGVKEETLVGRNFWDFVSIEDAPNLRDQLAQLSPASPELTVENRVATEAGSRWTLWTNRALQFDATGALVEAQSTGIDITDRKRAEEALRHSEHRFTRFMDHLPGLAWIKDVKGRYVYANEAAAQAFAIPRDRLIGMTDDEIFDAETAATFRENDRRALEAPEGIQVIETLRHADGTQHHSIVSKFAIPAEDGGGTLVGGVAIDITERKRAEEALRESAQRKDEFLAVLGHELRNPLAPLRNGLELLKGAPISAPQTERVLAMMDRQLAHLLRLVDDLLDVSRIGRGKAELRLAKIDLRTVISAAVEQAQPRLTDRGHSLNVRQAHVPLPVSGDLERLIQVVVNLLTNAATYTQRGGRIDLVTELDRERDEAVVRVVDSGLGIPSGRLDSIFEPFTQIPEHRSEAGGGGLGIGLALSREIVRMHGGTIEARSAGLGRGSEFSVRLPLTEPAAQLDQGPPPPRLRLPSKGKRILVVDDNADAAESLQQVLKAHGHTVCAVGDSFSALEAVRTFRPDVALLDIGLPQMDGYELARRIRSTTQGRSILLCAITGWGQAEDKRRAREAGFDEHMTKPVDIMALAALVSPDSVA